MISAILTTQLTENEEVKDKRLNQNRRRSSFYYGGEISVHLIVIMIGQNNLWTAIDQVSGRLTKPITRTQVKHLEKLKQKLEQDTDLPR